MKSLTTFFILILIFARSQGQVITDTSRCDFVKQGHLRDLINEFKSNCLDKRGHYVYKNVAFSNNRTISFLNKAFGTQIFNTYCFLEKSSSEIKSSKNGHGVSWGMAEIGFNSKKDNDKAIAIIKSQHRNSLQLEIATGFVLLREQNTIIVVFAEEPFLKDDTVSCFFNRLKMMKGYVPIQ